MTQLALAYFQMKFALEDEQTLVIADWWRSRPVDSLFYQVDQLVRWSASEPLPESALFDPLRNFGFGLALVFPWGNESVARSASSSNMISNTVVLPSDESSHPVGKCSLSLELLLTLWDESNGASFLHPNGGARAWLKFAENGDEAELLEYMNTAASATGNNDTLTIIEAQQISTGDVFCTLQGVEHWVRSWYNHPWLRGFVELLWVEPLAGSSTFFRDQIPDPTDLIAPFRLPSAPDNVVETTNASWQLLARLVLDPVENVSVVDPYEGYSLWSAQLLACADSDEESARCSFAKDVDVQVSENTTASAALNVLGSMISQRFGDLGAEPDTSLLVAMIQEVVVPWIISLLDSDTLQEFIRDHLQAVRNQEGGISDPVSLSSIGELAAVQFVNGSVTNMNFSLVHGDVAYTDVGRISERIAREDVVFIAQNSERGAVQAANSSFTPGFGELRAFCAENARDALLAYDRETDSCGLQADEYSLAPSDVAALWRVFADDTVELEWPTNTTVADEIARRNGFPLVSPLGNTTRVALLIDAFFAQPFASLADCSFVMANLAVAYSDSLTSQQIDAACVEQSLGGVAEVMLDLPMLAAAGFADKPRSFTTDLQAYLRYAATKFVYEPRVLGRTPAPLDLNAPLSPEESKESPLGGMIALTTVVRALFGSDDSEFPSAEALGIDGTAMTVPRHQELPVTFRIPRQQDMEAYTQRARAVGEVLAVNDSNAINIWGMKVPLSGLGATDGSQFTTAVLTGRTLGLAGQREFPPSTLQFYWPRARRLATLEYSQNITRFSSTLMRYCVADWTAPSTVPTGVVLVDEDAGSQALAAEGINMSYIADELPLVLQSADASTETVVDVDPVTGLVYHRRFVWQVTAVLSGVSERDGGVWHTQLAPLALPVAWVNEEASASPSSAMALARVAHLGPFATEKLAWWGVIGGSAYIAIGSALSYVLVRRARVARLRRF